MRRSNFPVVSEATVNFLELFLFVVQLIHIQLNRLTSKGE